MTQGTQGAGCRCKARGALINNYPYVMTPHAGKGACPFVLVINFLFQIGDEAAGDSIRDRVRIRIRIRVIL